MKRFSFRDLKEDYELLELRSTSLGSFSNGIVYPQSDPIKSNETTYFGDMIHNIVQTTLFDVEKGRQVMLEIKDQISDYEDYASVDNFKKFHKNMENYRLLACELKEQLPSPVLMIEREYRLLFDCSGYKICLGGCLDVILEDGTLVDIKTSSGYRDQAKELIERQQYYYSLLRCWSKGQFYGTQRFTYAIFTKHSPPRLQLLTKEIDLDDAEKVLKNDLRNYLTKLNEEKLKVPDGDIDRLI